MSKKLQTVSEAVKAAKVTKVNEYDDKRPDIYRVELPNGQTIDTHAKDEKSAREDAIGALNATPAELLTQGIKHDKKPS